MGMLVFVSDILELPDFVVRWHNSQWLEMVENRSVEDDVNAGYGGPEQDADPYIQGTEALDRPEYMFAGL